MGVARDHTRSWEPFARFIDLVLRPEARTSEGGAVERPTDVLVASSRCLRSATGAGAGPTGATDTDGAAAAEDPVKKYDIY